MPETPNHGYNVPDEGDQDWHEPLNENFEQYDTDIEVRDTEANRGNYEPKAGAKFFATDSGNVYVGDGSNWNRVGSTGTSPTFDELNPDGDFLGVGRSTTITGSETFGVRADTASYGGMYVDTTSTDGLPFYGYATDGEQQAWHFYDGATDRWHLHSNGANRLTVNGDGNVGVGTDDPDDRLHVDGDVTISNDRSLNIWWDAGTDDYIRTYVDMQQKEFNWVFNDSSMGFTSDGNFYVSGSKNFVQSVDTDDGEKEVVYTAAEAPTPRTEVSGVAELENGRAEVDLPEHFAWVTDDDEPLAVQTTPYGGSSGLKVVERSTDRVVVDDLEGEGDYEFAYTVRGTRDGYEDQEIVREPSAKATETARLAPADD